MGWAGPKEPRAVAAETAVVIGRSLGATDCSQDRVQWGRGATEEANSVVHTELSPVATKVGRWNEVGRGALRPVLEAHEPRAAPTAGLKARKAPMERKARTAGRRWFGSRRGRVR